MTRADGGGSWLTRGLRGHGRDLPGEADPRRAEVSADTTLHTPIQYESEASPNESLNSLTGTAPRPVPKRSTRRRLTNRISIGGALASNYRSARLAEFLKVCAGTPVAQPPAVIAFTSAYGGVGTSTLAVLVACELGLASPNRVVTVQCGPVGTLQGLARIRPGRQQPTEHMPDDDGDHQLFQAISKGIQQPVGQSADVVAVDPPTSDSLARAVALLGRSYDVITLDLGTAFRPTATEPAVDDICDQLVVVVPSRGDAAGAVLRLLRSLIARQGEGWVRQRVLVAMNSVRPSTKSDVTKIQTTLAPLVRSCVGVGWDGQLESGRSLKAEALSDSLRKAILVLAAELGHGIGAASRLLA